MLFKPHKLAASVALFSAIAGCTSSFELDNEHRYGKLNPNAEHAMQAVRGNTFVREIKSQDLALERPVFLTAQNRSLRSVLAQTLPGYSIIPRNGVDLNAPIDVQAHGMPMKDFIEYIEGTQDLRIELSPNGKKVVVTSFETKQWNLAAFASSRTLQSMVTSKQSAGAKAGDDENTVTTEAETTGSTISTTLSEDEWKTIMEGARRILGAPETVTPQQRQAQAFAPVNGGGGSQMMGNDMMSGLNFGSSSVSTMPTMTDERAPFLEGIRSVGIMTAGGKPSQIRILDDFLKQAIADATRIVNVQVRAYDVVLNNDKQKAIDWSVLSAGSISGNAFDVALNTSSAIVGDNAWNIAGTLTGDRGQGTGLVRLLETFGRVELQDQPNLTVRNGVPAQIYAGEELTYIADVEQAQDSEGNIKVTPKLARLKVGVTLAVTVRVLDDERLLVDVTPVISNLSGYDQIGVQDYSFSTPRISLKEFSTQLIVSSGESIHLGGLITEKLDRALEQLPWQNKVTKALVNPLFQSVNNSLERRELVLVVTPTVIEGTR